MAIQARMVIMTIFQRLFSLKKRDSKLNIADWFFVAAALVVFAVITFWTITKSSIWFDEAFGAYLSHFSFWDIARYTAADVHPPVYYWLLKLWGMMFGNTELALRSMSVLFGGLSIAFGYLIVRRLFNKQTARISLIFMALSPMLVRYGQEMRMYTLVAAIALAATYVLTFAIDSKKRLPWIIYGVLVGLGMWVHYFIAIVWIAHWIWRADNVRRIAKKGEFIKTFFSKEWIMAHVIAVAIFIPWMPFFVYQMSTVQAFGFWIPPVSFSTPINFFTNVILYNDLSKMTVWTWALFVAVVITLTILSFRVYKKMNEAELQGYRLIAMVSLVPVLLLIILSMPPLRPSFIDRYLITSTVAVAMFIGITLTYGTKILKPIWRAIAIVFVAGLMIIGVSNVWYLGNFNKNSHNSSGARQIVNAAVDKSINGQPIIAATPWMFYEAVFYNSSSHPIYYIDPINYPFGSEEMLKDNDQYKIKDVAAFTKDSPIFWYIAFSTSGKVDAPYSNWKELQSVIINDPISGGPEYKAIQYTINQ